MLAPGASAARVSCTVLEVCTSLDVFTMAGLDTHSSQLRNSHVGETSMLPDTAGFRSCKLLLGLRVRILQVACTGTTACCIC